MWPRRLNFRQFTNLESCEEQNLKLGGRGRMKVIECRWPSDR